MKKAIIDLIEGSYAICELDNMEMIAIKLDRLPQDIKEGTAIIIDGAGIRIDDVATKERHKEIKDLMNDLWE